MEKIIPYFNIHSPEYRKAFILYLRRGAPIMPDIKAEGHPTAHYIWHTRGDGKVRSSHAANNGKIFAWDNPPPTGHPGEDYGCRCWAEPVGGNEYARQLLISAVKDNSDRWMDKDFVLHYKNGYGTGVSLAETGYLGKVIDFYANDAIAKDDKPGVYRRVNQQIIDEAISKGKGSFTCKFEGSYEFGKSILSLIVPSILFPGILYSFGGSTVSGNFKGDVRKENDFLVINGIVTYHFSDEFTDPVQLIESTMFIFNITRQEAIELWGGHEDIGVPYEIADSWQTKFNATVRLTV